MQNFPIKNVLQNTLTKHNQMQIELPAVTKGLQRMYFDYKTRLTGNWEKDSKKPQNC